MHREALIGSLDPSPYAILMPRDLVFPSSVEDLPGEQINRTFGVHPRLEASTAVQERLSFAQ